MGGCARLVGGADGDRLRLKARALGDLLLKRRGPLLSQLFKFIALLLGFELCVLSSSEVPANSQKSRRLALFVHVRSPTRCDPAHIAIRTDNPKLCLVIVSIFDVIIDCLPVLIAIICIPSGNNVFARYPSPERKAQLSTPRRP